MEGHGQQIHHCVENLNTKSGERDDDGRGEGEGGEGEETSPGPRSAGPGSVVTTTIEDVRALRVKLETLLCESGLKIDLNLEVF